MGYVIFAIIFVVLDIFFIVLYPFVMIVEHNYVTALFSLGIGVVTIIITVCLLGAAQDADTALPDRGYWNPEASHHRKIWSFVDQNAPLPDDAEWPGIKTCSPEIVKTLGLAFLLAVLLFIVFYLIV